MAYQFTQDLETGNAVIDGEHRQLIEAINNLLAACGEGKGRSEVEATIEFLYTYTEKHFAHEEQLQVQYRYPDYANHKRYHQEYKKIVAGMRDDLRKQGPTVVLVGKVNTAIAGWLINHIKQEDKKVAAHIKNSK